MSATNDKLKFITIPIRRCLISIAPPPPHQRVPDFFHPYIFHPARNNDGSLTHI